MEMKKIMLAIGSFIVLISISIGCTYVFDYIEGGNSAREVMCIVLGCISFISAILAPVTICLKDYNL
jgi:hypothetical protein